jgi:hypothetical protein
MARNWAVEYEDGGYSRGWNEPQARRLVEEFGGRAVEVKSKLVTVVWPAMVAMFFLALGTAMGLALVGSLIGVAAFLAGAMW